MTVRFWKFSLGRVKQYLPWHPLKMWIFPQIFSLLKCLGKSAKTFSRHTDQKKQWCLTGKLQIFSDNHLWVDTFLGFDTIIVTSIYEVIYQALLWDMAHTIITEIPIAFQLRLHWLCCTKIFARIRLVFITHEPPCSFPFMPSHAGDYFCPQF